MINSIENAGEKLAPTFKVLTPPRPSEIRIKNWRAKVKPVLTPHL